jgi:hypothetical protein
MPAMFPNRIRRPAFLLLSTALLVAPSPCNSQAAVRLDHDVEIGVLTGAATGTDGRVCISDSSDQLIHCLAPDGKLLWTVGGRGEGPGEFQGLYRVTLTSGNALIAFDLAKRSVSLFAPTGTYVGSARVPLAFSQVISLVSLAPDTLLLSGVVHAAGTASRFALHVFAWDDTLAYVRSFAPLPEGTDERKRSLFGPGLASLSRSGTILYSRRYPYELIEYDRTGTKLREVDGPVSIRGGPDDLFAIVEESTKTTYRYLGEALRERIGAIFELRPGSWTVFRTTPEGNKVYDEYDWGARRWRTSPLPKFPVVEPSVLGSLSRIGSLLVSGTCEAEPCLFLVKFP